MRRYARLCRSCLTNVLRHSGSEKAEIRIARNAEEVTLKVQNHGTGISEEKLATLNEGGSGVGIHGMRDRVRQLNGFMTVESNSSGTTISITLPLPGEPIKFNHRMVSALTNKGFRRSPRGERSS